MSLAADSNPPREYSLIVIGAGPAGCEASLAAAAAGLTVLCLTINLDTVAVHPANPRIVSGGADPRGRLLDELGQLGGALPRLLACTGATSPAAPDTVIIDRRQLGLLYKERMETSAGVELRQTLATGVDRYGEAWHIETRLGERFAAPSLVIATGTFLDGRVDEAGVTAAGGRHGEIPSRSLARSLASLGLGLLPTDATCYPRLDGRNLSASPTLPPDGQQLGELYGDGREPQGNRLAQLRSLRQELGLGAAWMTRSLYYAHHLILDAEQVDESLACPGQPGLFVAGRTAGSCNYIEAAALGLVAGRNAAAMAQGRRLLIHDYRLVKELCRRIAHQQERPVTVRVEPPGC